MTNPEANTDAIILPPPIRRRRRLQAPIMPPLDQPAEAATPIVRSYKVPFTLTAESGWSYSEDGGKNNHSSGSDAIGGSPTDITLTIAPANWEKGAFDWRLSLEFVEDGGDLCEINLNGLRPSKDDRTLQVMTGPTRSLLGSILAICDERNEDVEANIASFIAGARFTLRPGNAPRSQFIETAVTQMNEKGDLIWNPEFSGPKVTSRIPNTPDDLIRAVEIIKEVLRARGHFGPGPAVIGKELVVADLPSSANDDIVVVPVASTAVED